VKTSSQRLKPDFWQMHPHKTDRLTPDSTQQQNAFYARSRHGTTVSFVFLSARISTVIIYFYFLLHRTNGTLVESSVMEIGYYISSRKVVRWLESEEMYILVMTCSPVWVVINSFKDGLIEGSKVKRFPFDEVAYILSLLMCLVKIENENTFCWWIHHVRNCTAFAQLTRAEN
jgi:hypothetical protein